MKWLVIVGLFIVFCGIAAELDRNRDAINRNTASLGALWARVDSLEAAYRTVQIPEASASKYAEIINGDVPLIRVVADYDTTGRLLSVVTHY